jgi:hypothetical protein
MGIAVAMSAVVVLASLLPRFFRAPRQPMTTNGLDARHIRRVARQSGW